MIDYLKRLKFRKYDKVVFIDTENVGYSFPTPYSEKTYYIFFMNIPNDGNACKKIKSFVNYTKNFPNVEIINIVKYKEQYGNLKNMLDFILVCELNSRLPYISHKDIVVRSRDKGYLSAILYLKNKYPSLSISLNGTPLTSTLPTNFIQTKDVRKQLEKLDVKSFKNLKEKITTYTNFRDLYKTLSRPQKEALSVFHGFQKIDSQLYNIFYDVYTHGYVSSINGHMESFPNLESAQNHISSRLLLKV